MKKKTTKDQEQKRQPHRLSLNRETIRILNDPALLEIARGGTLGSGTGHGSDLNTQCPTTGKSK